MTLNLIYKLIAFYLNIILVKPKEVNSIEVRRHSTDSCCFDPATNSLLERIEKQNFELYKKAQQNNS
jgi:hypothetical protein